MSARDVIASFLLVRDENVLSWERTDDERADSAKAILEALTAAGYRILGPDELDPATADLEFLYSLDSSCGSVRDGMELTRACRERAEVVVDLMQRVWANLYFDEQEAGDTFQQTLDEVVDWLSVRNALPEAPQPEAKEQADD